MFREDCVLFVLQVLLGTFTCTAVPGEFVWMPGLLTKVLTVTFLFPKLVLYLSLSFPCCLYYVTQVFSYMLGTDCKTGRPVLKPSRRI